jgi:penicillin amidase
MKKLLPTFAALLGVTACHPLACWHPADLPKDAPKEIKSSNDTYPAGDVEVLYDTDGIPHIYGDSEPDLSYGLGWVHGRDRLFQLTFRKHAAQGRLSELLNDPERLGADQFLRILTYDIDKQLADLSDRDRALFEAYAAGVNDGAAEINNTTAELTILGFEPEPFTVLDVMSVVRIMLDTQTSGVEDELAYSRIVNRLEEGDPRIAELTQELGVLAPAIVATAEQSDLLAADATPRTKLEAYRLAQQTRELADKARKPGKVRPHKTVKPKAPTPDFGGDWSTLLHRLLPDRMISNSWAVHGSRTASGKSFLANDPHMTHDGPALWEYVHMKRSDGWEVAGGSIAGIPGVIIGYSPNAAWGMTNATMDCEDLYAIRPAPGNDGRYMLDGEAVEYGEVEQTYKLGNGPDAETFTETWKTTAFGPLVPPGWEFRLDEGDLYAFQSCSFFHAERASTMVSAFWDLPASETPLDAVKAIDRFTQASFSMPVVLKNGDIVWRMSGTPPLRVEGARYDRPQRGDEAASAWQGLTNPADKPLLVNPQAGYFVASNQRVVEPDHPMVPHLGWDADSGERANRIHTLLGELLADGNKPSADELYAIQQDLHSLQAERLSGILGDNCPSSLDGYEERHIAPLCESLRSFDAKYTTETLGGLAFQWTWDFMREEMVAAALGDEIRELSRPATWDATPVYVNLEHAVIDEAGGEQWAILDDPATSEREGIAGFMKRALPRTIDRLKEAIGDDPNAWRWGAVHTLEFKGLLFSAPVIGGLFSTPRTEQTGNHKVIRAERGTPITGGSALRIRSEAGDGTATSSMILDNGNSGHFGHRHMHNMHERWNVGETINAIVPRSDVEANIDGWAKISPK